MSGKTIRSISLSREKRLLLPGSELTGDSSGKVVLENILISTGASKDEASVGSCGGRFAKRKGGVARESSAAPKTMIKVMNRSALVMLSLIAIPRKLT